jgi:hypothetical protein
MCFPEVVTGRFPISVQEASEGRNFGPAHSSKRTLGKYVVEQPIVLVTLPSRSCAE